MCDQLILHGLDPFGRLPGFHTDRGVVALPTEPVHGYLYSQEQGCWVIAAEEAKEERQMERSSHTPIIRSGYSFKNEKQKGEAAPPC